MASPAKPKLCVISTTPLSVHLFLREHLRGLSEFFDIILLVNSQVDSYVPPLDIPVDMRQVSIERAIKPLSDLRTLRELYGFFRKERVDIVWAVGPKAGLLAMTAGFAARVSKRIFIFQGEVWASKRGIWRWILRQMDSVTARCATHLIAVSKSERDFLDAEGVVSASRVKVLGAGSICGVDLLRFHPDAELRAQLRAEACVPENALVMLFVGRLNLDKGVLELAQAFRIAAESRPHLWLIVVGPDEGGVIPELTRLVGASFVRCRIFGFCTRIERYVCAADFLCLPSYREGFPIVVLEAAASGIATIGFDTYGMTDAIERDATGLLVRMGDVRDLAAAICRICDDAELRERLGRAARARAVSHFEQARVVERYVEFFRNGLD